MHKLAPTVDGLSPALEFKFAANAAGVIRGYGSTFGGVPDAFGDVIAPHAFTQSLAAHERDGTSPLMFFSHDPEKVIGAWSAIAEDARGLKVEGQLALGTQAGRETYELLKMDALNGLSIGYRTIEAMKDKGGARVLLKVDLIEISVVALPANRAARISGVKSVRDDIDCLRNFEAALSRCCGFSRSEAKALARGGWSALAEHDAGDDGLKRLFAALHEQAALFKRNSQDG